MTTPAERDVFERWRPAVIGLLIASSLALFALVGSDTGESWSWPVAFAAFFTALLPEFIGALIVAVAVYYFVKSDERTHYVSAMRALRLAVSGMQDEGKLKAADVQSLMIAFVPAVSSLYFKTNEPPVSPKAEKVTFEKLKCFSCKEPSPVVKGRCSKCRDIVDSWREEERAAAGRILRID